MSSSSSVWIWVSQGGRDGDRLNVSFEDGRGRGMATDLKRSEFLEGDGTKRTYTEVGEDGMDPGERLMRSEFLLGDPREADEEVGMREGLEEKRRDTHGRGRSSVGWRSWSSLVVVVVV